MKFIFLGILFFFLKFIDKNVIKILEMDFLIFYGIILCN